MWNALFAYEEPARAEDVRRALVDAGIGSDAVTVHLRASGARGGTAELVDEQVTGGVLTNLYNLFQGVFDWGNSSHDAAAYEEVVNRGGAVLEVRAGLQQRSTVDSIAGAGSSHRTAWHEGAR